MLTESEKQLLLLSHVEGVYVRRWNYDRLHRAFEDDATDREASIGSVAISPGIAITSSTSSTPETTTNEDSNEIAKKKKRMDKVTINAGNNGEDEKIELNAPSNEIISTTTTSFSITSTAPTSKIKLPNPEGDEAGKQRSENKPVSINANSGIGIRFNTVWESLKRLMGFTPECHNGGFKSIGSRSCTCPQYFEGHFCERIVCANGGSRIRVAAFGDEEVCKCPNPDYIKGKHCEQVHCQNGGRLLNDGTCHCVDGWYSGQFCQYYTSSWLIAIGIPLLFIAIVIFCCFICRMDLCALRRSPTYRSRSGDRRSNNRRRHHQHRQHNDSPEHNGRGRAAGNAIETNYHRREQIPFRQHRERDHPNMHLQQPPPQFYICQNLLNDQQRQQQYMVRLEQIPVYNPNVLPIDTAAAKPMEPPPPYEQAILCSPPNQNPPTYCSPLQQQQQLVTNVLPGDRIAVGTESENNSIESDQNLVHQ